VLESSLGVCDPIPLGIVGNEGAQCADRRLDPASRVTYLSLTFREPWNNTVGKPERAM